MAKINQRFRSATDTFGELFCIYFLIIMSSGFLYSVFEGKSLTDGIWWAIVTGLTVGYGDLYPTTLPGKIVSILLMHSVILFIIPLIVARIVTKVINNRHEFTHREQEAIKKQLDRIEKSLR